MDIQAEGKPDTEVQGDENAPKKGVKRGDGKVVETPLMRQYYEIKQQHPDAVLLFRVGDFYETFGEDAIFASKVLNIVLTRKANGSHTFIELAGFPHHALETYLYKLVRAGGKVAICEQLEDPKLTKKLVKRGVTELITPGISLNDRLLENGKNNFLCGLYPGQAGPAGWGASLRQAASKKKSKPAQEMGISFLDVSTGEFFVAEGNMEYIHKLIDNFQPSEIVMPRDYRDEFFRLFGNRYYVTVFEDWVFKPDFARELLLKHFKTNSLKGFGVENMVAAQIAAASCLHYLIESKHEQSSHISSLQKIVESRYVWMDAFTLRNLELLQPSSTAVDDSKEAENSLWAVLDKTSTPMGSRLLRRMICLPLKDKDQLEERFDYVQTLVENREAADFLEDKLSQIGDLERLLSKVAAMRALPREMLQLKNTLGVLAGIKSWGETALSEIPLLQAWAASLDECSQLHDYLAKSIDPDAPALLSKGGVVASGVDAELDELRRIAYSGKEYLAELLQRESRQSGISGLKLGFNNVYGYYLEVTHSFKDKVPAEWVRKQTLTNAERYITQDLKEYEEKVLTAQDKITTVEAALYQKILEYSSTFIKRIQESVQKIASFDVMLSFAKVAAQNKYVRPQLMDSYDLEIIQGRHPVIERHIPAGQKYVPNDIRFQKEGCRIMMITGPNMSGKSAVLRQTALIVLMAQIGCFVPAEAARIGLVDKIFTRVGATDNLASGESTFMVEMNETANILNNLTDRSLVLLDEIGRGTSTYDGISIAWAIAEYLHDIPKRAAKVLFATHYHELNQMAARFPHIRNYHVRVKEMDGQVIFLRTLAEGGSEHSFGIHVAQMAGMPRFVVERAEEILGSLEKGGVQGGQQRAILPGLNRVVAGLDRTEGDVTGTMEDSGQAEASECQGGGEASLETCSGKDIDGQMVGDEATFDSPERKVTGKRGDRTMQPSEKEVHKPYQLSFIQLDDPLLEKIRDEIMDLDINSLTPVQALNKLDEIKRLLGKK